MPTSVQQVVDCLSAAAPLSLAESWDNVGLLLGDPNSSVASIVVALDPCSEVLDFAAEKSAELLVTHHPLYLKPPLRLLANDPVGRLVLRCARAGLNLVAMHTNLDHAAGGVGDALAAELNLVNVRVLSPAQLDAWRKVVVFVPAEYIDKVRDSMASNGAGVIGEYTHCSFQSAGVGTFVPSEKAQPFIGATGQLERADEYRLEMLVSKSLLPGVLKQMIESHPYEEVAYDVYPLENPGKPLGCLKLGELDPPLSRGEFMQRVLNVFDVDSARVVGDLPDNVQSVAVCGGSGATCLDVVAASEAEVFVTGDTKHHDALRAREAGLAIVDVGHAVSEQVAVDLLERWLQEFAQRETDAGSESITIYRAPEPLPWRQIVRERQRRVI